MISQLTKTIKMALKSTEEERAVLRARSAVQRFPVVEWRQRMEDFHKRSINISRGLAGSNAWRESDCNGGSSQPIHEHDDWNPVAMDHPSEPAWDSRSINEGSGMNSPYTPGSPGQWNHGDVTPGRDVESPHRQYPSRGSYTPSMDDGTSNDYFSHSRASTAVESPGGYNNFLEKANRTIGRDQHSVPDPFTDGHLAPNKPFGSHSRVSSRDSISSIVEDKSDSPLNKAIVDVSDILIVLYLDSSNYLAVH